MMLIPPILKQAIRRERKGIVISVLLAVGQSISLYPVALLVNRIFDVQLPNEDTNGLTNTVVYMAMLFIVQAVLVLIHRYVTINIVKRQVAVIRIQAADSIISRSRKNLSDKDRDMLHAYVVQDSMRIDGFFTSLLNRFIPSTLITIALSLVAATINIVLFAIILAMAPIVFLLDRWMGNLYRESIREYHTDFNLFSKQISFLAKHDDLIHASSAEALESRKSTDKIEKLKRSTTRTSFIASLYALVQHQLILIGGAVVLLIGGLAVVNGSTSIGNLISFYVAIGLLSSHARSAIGAIPSIIEGKESLERMYSIMHDGEQSPYTGTTYIDTIRSIEFKNVVFSFEGKPTIINELSFRCVQGDTIWLKGPSGCGKTTIAMLLMGFYKPISGHILINDLSLDEIDVLNLRRLFGVSMQDPTIFSATIRENLIYGFEEPPNDQSILNICSIVEIDETIIELPQGLDTFVGERGMTLSGGERQRLSIARALLHHPHVLILDEPENNLPPNIAKKMVERTERVDRIRLIISHKKVPHSELSVNSLAYEITRCER